MQKILIVVDMQKDFVDGALGTAEAEAIVPHVCKKIENFDGEIVVTYDTHFENYMQTGEGKNLPVPHCIKGTEGHALDINVQKALLGRQYISVEKVTFGASNLPVILSARFDMTDVQIEVCGLCTDICVVSNVLLLKAHFPEVAISVDSSCCAGVTPQKHEAALETMRSCQIDVR